MILKNKYAFGLLLQWYEIEMVKEHIDSLIQMMEGIENPENVTFDFCISMQTYLEQFDRDKIQEFIDNENFDEILIKHTEKREDQLMDLFNLAFISRCNKLIKDYSESDKNPKIVLNFISNQKDFYNIASYRRDFNHNYAQKVDLLCWSETDSLWPKQTLELLEALHENVRESTPKYIVNFADRRLWDNSFAPLHPRYENVPFKDDEEWQFNSPDSGKGYMSLEQMNEINQVPLDEVKVSSFTEPRFDGSCVCFSSDLIKAGINIPHALIHCSEDVSLGVIAKKLLGDQFVQFCFQNILHVHNRRHPHKRSYIKGETNPNGKCTVQDKGEWWKILEDSSKENFSNLFTQNPFIKMDEVMEKIKLSKGLVNSEK